MKIEPQTVDVLVDTEDDEMKISYTFGLSMIEDDGFVLRGEASLTRIVRRRTNEGFEYVPAEQLAMIVPADLVHDPEYYNWKGNHDYVQTLSDKLNSRGIDMEADVLQGPFEDAENILLLQYMESKFEDSECEDITVSLPPKPGDSTPEMPGLASCAPGRVQMNHTLDEPHGDDHD